MDPALHIVPLDVDKAREVANATVKALLPSAHLTARGFGLPEITAIEEEQS